MQLYYEADWALVKLWRAALCWRMRCGYDASLLVVLCCMFGWAFMTVLVCLTRHLIYMLCRILG